MSRTARLASARTWLAAFEGKHVVRAYARWYRVDRLCAVLELRKLGVSVDPVYEASLRRTAETMAIARAEARARQAAAAEALAHDHEAEHAASWGLAYIAGYTSAGFPYGVPLEDMPDDE